MKSKMWVLLGAIAAGATFCAMAATFLVQHANPSVKDDPLLFSAIGHPVGLGERDGLIHVRFDWDQTTYLIPDSNPEILTMLNTASDAGEEVDLRVQMAGANFDPDTGLPIFWVRHLKYRGKEFGPYPVKIPWSWRMMLDEQVALLRGIGITNDGRFNQALTELNRSLETGVLRPAQRGLALASRGYVFRYKVYGEPAQAGKDFLLVRAAEDFTAAAKLLPDDESIPAARAGVLIELGAYEDALAVLRQARANPAKPNFQAGIMSADLLRRLGREAESLKVLDEVGESRRDPLGMSYYYHRGWTQLLMNRNAEAAASFAQGLKTQKGWPWAYIGRGCARHAMGDDDTALSDLRKAVELADRAVNKDRGTEAAERAELRNNIAALENRAPQAKGPANLTICTHFQPNFDRPLRERSKLLKAAA